MLHMLRSLFLCPGFMIFKSSSQLWSALRVHDHNSDNHSRKAWSTHIIPLNKNLKLGKQNKRWPSRAYHTTQLSYMLFFRTLPFALPLHVSLCFVFFFFYACFTSFVSFCLFCLCILCASVLSSFQKRKSHMHPHAPCMEHLYTFIIDLPCWELIYPIPRHFWRWFSFSQGGIC